MFLCDHGCLIHNFLAPIILAIKDDGGGPLSRHSNAGPNQTPYYTNALIPFPSRMWNLRSKRDSQEQRTRETGKARRVLLLGTYALSLRSPAPHPVELGPSESGKSTIIKQMCITYQGGFCHDARVLYRGIIYSNLLESAQAVAIALHKFDVKLADPSSAVSSSDHGSLASFSIPFRVANLGTLAGLRSQCVVTVSDMLISLYLPESDRRGYTQSLGRPSST